MPTLTTPAKSKAELEQQAERIHEIYDSIMDVMCDYQEKGYGPFEVGNAMELALAHFALACKVDIKEAQKLLGNIADHLKTAYAPNLEGLSELLNLGEVIEYKKIIKDKASKQ